MRHIIRERRMCSCTAYRTRSWPKSLSIAAIPSSLKERVYPLSARRCPRTLRASVWSERRQDLRILEGALERVQDLLEGSDLRRPSTGQPQRRSRHAWSCECERTGFVISLLPSSEECRPRSGTAFEAGRYPEPFHTT